jgi:hypothetical protein
MASAWLSQCVIGFSSWVFERRRAAIEFIHHNGVI